MNEICRSIMRYSIAALAVSLAGPEKSVIAAQSTASPSGVKGHQVRKPVQIRQVSLSKAQADRLARQRGYTFFYPRYWPNNLPKATISSHVGNVRANEDYRTAITVSAEKQFPYKDVPGVSPSLVASNSRRFITIILDRPERVPSQLKPDFRRNPVESESHLTPRDRGYTSPVAIRGTKGAIVRDSPQLTLAWREKETYILMIAINVKESDLIRIARSLYSTRQPKNKSSSKLSVSRLLRCLVI
jgi:hypothetical protein